jgi:hypothetical protein
MLLLATMGFLASKNMQAAARMPSKRLAVSVAVKANHLASGAAAGLVARVAGSSVSPLMA